MATKCNDINCQNFQFGGGFCKYHQYMRSMRGGDKYQPKSRGNGLIKPRSPKNHTPIPKQSKKREIDQKHYAEHCRELAQEIRDKNNGKIYCFFSGVEISKMPVFHHLLGRTGKFYLDKELLVPCDNETHLEYHRMTVVQLEKTQWYKGFIERLLIKSKQAYDKEMKKKQKEVNIFED
jgi:hypothetical protein